MNLTDKDSRPVKTPRGFIQGYNAQAVATQDQIVVAADLIQASPDGGQLAPMIRAARRELASAGGDDPRVVLADAGYWSATDIRRLRESGLTVLVPPDAHTRAEPNPRRRGGLYDDMRQRLASKDGHALYRRRMTSIEPIFGQIKHN